MLNRKMKYLKRFNEGIMDDIARINPIRRENDDKFSKLSDDIIEDFEKCNKDLRKVRIMENETEISLTAIEVGKSYSIGYVFGTYHTVKRNLMTDNRENFDRRIKIVKIPFSYVLKKNELERAFNTGRLNLGKCRVEDVKTLPNYDRNPNIGNNALHKIKKDEYYISSDVANKLFTYFLEEYVKQYPELKDTLSKSSMDISDIEKGVPVSVKFIHVKSKDGKDLTYQLRKGENESEVRKKLSNMTDEEYNSYWKQRNKDLYADSRKTEESNKVISNKFRNIIKPLSINIELSEWEKERGGFDIRVYSDEVRIEFKTRDTDIKNKLKDLPKEFEGYKLTFSKVSDGYGDTQLKFVAVIYEK